MITNFQVGTKISYNKNPNFEDADLEGTIKSITNNEIYVVWRVFKDKTYYSNQTYLAKMFNYYVLSGLFIIQKKLDADKVCKLTNATVV